MNVQNLKSFFRFELHKDGGDLSSPLCLSHPENSANGSLWHVISHILLAQNLIILSKPSVLASLECLWLSLASLGPNSSFHWPIYLLGFLQTSRLHHHWPDRVGIGASPGKFAECSVTSCDRFAGSSGCIDDAEETQAAGAAACYSL
jgi:hypothetical protein